ncbi:MAG: SEC-C domain-containing protein [Pseudonocardia sp.]|nr:SEC-C domain-containing protein [Pseudonocardia sp.]
MTVATKQARTHALELESDLDRYPEERGAILLEAAGEWERAGEFDRARGLLAAALVLGGDEASWARYRLASLCFQDGADEEARAHLQVLEQSAGDVAGPAGLVAELLEERGEHEAALSWFERALGPDLDAVAAAVYERDMPSFNDFPLYGRRRCRAVLGLPVDDLDRAADLAERHRVAFAARLRAAVTATAAPRPARLEMLVWPRAELEQAAQRWPAVFARTDNQAGVEHELRRQSVEQHLATVTLIVGTADGLSRYLECTGADVGQESTRLAYAEEARVRGETISWPPGRNQSCWCGSARKYKKCCGGPMPG